MIEYVPDKIKRTDGGKTVDVEDIFHGTNDAQQVRTYSGFRDFQNENIQTPGQLSFDVRAARPGMVNRALLYQRIKDVTSTNITFRPYLEIEENISSTANIPNFTQEEDIATTYPAGTKDLHVFFQFDLTVLKLASKIQFFGAGAVTLQKDDGTDHIGNFTVDFGEFADPEPRIDIGISILKPLASSHSNHQSQRYAFGTINSFDGVLSNLYQGNQ